MPQIKTYARVKPSRELFDDVDIVDGDLLLRIPDAVHYYTSPTKAPSKLTHQFHFDQVFQPETSQEQVFETVAVDIIDAFLAGYNGTIFAYGQTGTGKTYTVEGGVRRYRDRGLAARALSRIYSSLAERGDEEISVHVSFLEIYQEVGYDLLNPAAQGQSLVTPFPRVTVMEGPGGSAVIRDLTTHRAASEEVAQNLLLQGQLNRRVAETPVNQRSSRSHAVLTITLAAKKTDSDVIVRSKLHLVDLAGSERVAKTGVDGQQLSEAKSINLSLHHLESVIIALQSQATPNEGKRKGSSDLTLKDLTSDPGCPRHIPYRNSLLTMLLRDSLGGNCLTAMVATISLEWQNLGETISTCRFAQRVACIANSIRRNEEIDDRSLVRILRKKIAELETEITCLKLAQGCEDQADSGTGKLTDEDKLRCGQVIRDYLLGHIRDPISAGITDPFKFRECMRILKAMVKQQANKGFQELGAHPSRDEPHSRASYTPHSRPSPANCLPANHRQAAARSTSEINNGLKTRSKSMSNLCPDVERRNTSDTGLVQTNSDDTCYVGGVERTPSAGRAASSVHKPRPSSAQQVLSKSPYAARQRHPRRAGREASPSLQHHNTPLSPESLRKLQRLMKTFHDLERKRGICEGQLRDQRSYISHLQAADIEGAVLDREHQLEECLCKTQTSICNKLDRVYQRMVGLCMQGEVGAEGDQTGDTRPWEERYGQFRKSDGSLNTKEVLEAITERNNKMGQAGLEDRVDGKNLSEKENATRRKLLHFKKLLQENKLLVNPDSGDHGGEFVTPSKPSHPGSNSTPKAARVVAWEMDRPRTKPDMHKRTAETLHNFSDELSRIYGESVHRSPNTHQGYTDAAESPYCANNYISTPNRPTKVDDKQLFSPSEYVNRIGSQEVFDAHQMGLYSQSFEAALTAMLERDNAKLFSHDNYNRYARGPSPDRRPSKPRKAGRLFNTPTANFVQNHFESYHAPTDIPGYSLTNNSDAYPILQSPGSSPRETDSVTVQAIPDADREMSFMSKAREQRSRIEKIRRAQSAASLIQRTWRRYRSGQLQTA